MADKKQERASYTPGPWRAQRTSIGYTIKADDQAGPKNGIGLPAYSIQFAKVWEVDPNGNALLPFRANARLIAAAPELLAAARAALEAFRYMRDKDTQHWDFHVTPKVCTAWDRLRTAIQHSEQGE